MKKIFLLLMMLPILHSLSFSEYVLEEALTQNGKYQKIEETSDYTIYRIIPGNNDSFQWPYLLKIGTKVLSLKQPVILVEMVNTGRVSDSFRFLQELALQSIQWGSRYDEKFKDRFVFMIPMIPRPLSDRKFYTHALDRDCFMEQNKEFERIDLQVLAMIQDCHDFLRKELSLETEEKVGIRGFSGAGVFAQRFSAIHPNKIKFCIAGGFSGMPLLPIEELDGMKLRYPIGVSDFKDLMGETFDFDAYAGVPRFLHMGGDETNDAVDYSDAYDDEDRELVNTLLGENPPERWQRCVEILQKYETKNEYHTDPNVGHAYSEDMKIKIEEFINRVLKSR